MWVRGQKREKCFGPKHIYVSLIHVNIWMERCVTRSVPVPIKCASYVITHSTALYSKNNGFFYDVLLHRPTSKVWKRSIAFLVDLPASARLTCRRVQGWLAGECKVDLPASARLTCRRVQGWLAGECKVDLPASARLTCRRVQGWLAGECKGDLPASARLTCRRVQGWLAGECKVDLPASARLTCRRVQGVLYTKRF